MKVTRWFLHPILIFILSIAALGTSLFLYIYWYMEASVGLRAVVDRFNLDAAQFMAAETWVVIMVLSLLVGAILMGIFSIFVYGQKSFQLYRLQNNFINNFTHELKTPVTSLKLYLQTFSKHELPRSDQIKYIQYMISDVSRLSDNINRILNLARIESKSYERDFVQMDLVAVVDGFVSDNKHLFQNAHIRVHRVDRRLPKYRINLPLIEMLLMNLMTNAIKYNDSKHPEIDIRFITGKRHLRICFQDNGIGFDKKEMRKIFRKFYQVGDVDTMSARGIGLGLYLVRTIAHIHKWRIVATSDGKGKGSVFTLKLPVYAPA